MSLGTWFRDYVYIPLGGNRVSKKRWFLNILIVWFLTGMWHGASLNFIVWGLFYCLFLIIEKIGLFNLLKNKKIINHIYVMLIVILGFVIFDATDLSSAIYTIGSMFGLQGYSLNSMETVYYAKSCAVIFVLAIIGATPIVKNVYTRLFKNASIHKILKCVEPFILILLMLVVTGFIVDGSFNPFLYFRF